MSYIHDENIVFFTTLYKYARKYPTFAAGTFFFAEGAMKIDVWRILVIYGYGGLYCDSDMYPKEGFTESSPISADDQAFFASDAVS